MSDAEALDRILSNRFSCRAYRPEPVQREVVTRIVSVARKVPSWCNCQPWHLTICEGAARDRLEAALLQAVETAPHAPDIAFPERYAGIYRERRRVCGWQLYAAVGIEKGDRAASARQMRENFRFFGAPQVAIVTTPADLGAYGAVDCGGFVTAFCLAAQALGVASIPQAAIASYSGPVRAALGVAEDRHVLCAISFGYADADHPANGFRTERAGVDEVVDWRG